MNDVSRIDARLTTQSRPGKNSDGIIPSRRNTTAPELQVFADLRNGRRGDGGAEELVRVLGGVSKAAGAVGGALQETLVQRLEREAKEDRDQANDDAFNGVVDDTKMAEHAAYRKWRTDGLMSEELVNVTSAIKTDIAALANSGEPYDIEDAREIIRRHHQGIFVDPETGATRNVRLFTTEGRAKAASHMAQLSQELLPQVAENMRQEEASQALNRAIAGSIDLKPAGGAYDVDAFVKSLPPQINKTAAIGEWVTAVVARAKQDENLEGLLDLIERKKEDGKTPLFGARVTAQLRMAAEAVEDAREERITRERTDRWEEGANALYSRMVSGNKPSVGEIGQMIERGDIAPSVGLSMKNHLESEAREAASRRRSALADQQDRRDAEVAVGITSLAINWKLGNGPMNSEAFGKEIERLQRRGDLGGGKAVASHMGALFSAYRDGLTTINNRPDVRGYGQSVAEWARRQGPGALLSNPKGDPVFVQEALSQYHDLVFDEGKRPAEAARIVKNQKLPSATSVDSRIAALEARRKQQQGK
ncbi:hypothetical protein [Sphingomonas crocodyli]|uniref:Uncharacterized protein n=1 Tax=Sphingomonas crocodyli TaxID=1979270 RepID=A0A437M0Q1_9SPHN|nr:hypothetical protein [Sphingomonas crocodyli]RVT91289.1 hypothetical protein EOD43_17435 [Sphingomonas crocodyli]